MDNLVIGNTSQLAPYFPGEYVKIPSRNIDYDFITSTRWRDAYICFAEQRTFLENSTDIFLDVNYSYTIEVVNKIKGHCERIYFYSTTYLWNAYEGAIDLSMPFKYYETPYIKSKEQITNYLINNVENAIILFPCNFNSVFRKQGFLFHKIFDSIIHKKKITIGNTYFYREMVHPRYIVGESLNTATHKIIGPGYAINVNEFIRALYRACNLQYEKYVIEKIDEDELKKQAKYYHSKKATIDYTQDDLLRDTVSELMSLKS